MRTASAPAKIKALRQRGDYLAHRMRSEDCPPREHHELAALAWALPILDDLVRRNAETAVDVHRQSRDAAYAWLASVAVERLAECDPQVAAGVLSMCSDESVRRAVIRNVREHSGHPGLAEHLSELVAVRP
jgi:hypothetical protein